MTTTIDGWFLQTQEWIERHLEDTLAPRDEVPEALGAAMRYAVLGGGKRFRPALVRLVGHWFGARDAELVAPAVAIECVHAYSLIHDDLPCMDDDDWRRGRPSCHKQFGQALAVLAGDALQTEAFAVLSREPVDGAFDPRVAQSVAVLARASGAAGMVGGQVLDMSLVGPHFELDAIAAMHRKKTGALIAAAAELGAIAASAEPSRRALAAEWGHALGACFQAVDDCLDVTANRAELGKTPGKDAAQGKPSLVAALGLEGTRRRAETHGERARVLAMELGGPSSELALQLVRYLLDRRS